MKAITRRALLAGAATSAIRAKATTTQTSPSGFYTLTRQDGRWWFLTPGGDRFFSLGFNHIDAAALRFADSRRIWQEKYANSMEQWLRTSVRPNLLDWGFNTVGWVQEVVSRQPTNHRHSRNFIYEEYQWLDLPYCHMLPVADFHQWEFETRNPDFQSQGFEDWCDYVARAHCGRLMRDPKLIGYWYLDCPTWVHTRPGMEWKGPIFDPDRLASDAGRRELHTMATRYYKVIHDAVRRHDPHHLILGDRYEANAPLPMEVVRAALPYVDALCFQDFRAPVQHLAEWYERTDKPVLWADGARGQKVDGADYVNNDGSWWADSLTGLRKNPGCVGAHICGAYIRNDCRRRGLLAPDETPDETNIRIIRSANRQTLAALGLAG